MPRFQSINFYQNKPKIKLFLQKIKVFWPIKAFDGWGRGFQTPETAPPPLQISGYAPNTKRVLLILPSFRILQWEVIELVK